MIGQPQAAVVGFAAAACPAGETVQRSMRPRGGCVMLNVARYAATYVFQDSPGRRRLGRGARSGTLSLRLPTVWRGVALSWHAIWPAAAARRGSRRVCSARSSVVRPR